MARRDGEGEEEGIETSAFWEKRNVLVTGADGFLGAHVCARLRAGGCTVVGLLRDRRPSSPLHTHADPEFIEVYGDLRDRMLLERVILEYEIDTVFHLAAQTQVRVANKGPLSTFESNIRGSYLLLESIRQYAPEALVVVASSDKAYGPSPTLPYTEEMPLRARYPYDVSKSCMDMISSSYAHSFGLRVGITRCANLYGPGDLNFDRLIPGTIRSLLRGERPVIRSDGSPVRDYLYVDDAARACLFLVHALHQGIGIGEAFNLSLEMPMRVLDVVRRIQSLMGRMDLEPRIEGHIPNELREQSLSAARARSLLGWRPVWTFDEGLGKTIEWYEKRWLREKRGP